MCMCTMYAYTVLIYIRVCMDMKSSFELIFFLVALLLETLRHSEILAQSLPAKSTHKSASVHVLACARLRVRMPFG